MAFTDRAVHFCPVIVRAPEGQVSQEIDRWKILNNYNDSQVYLLSVVCRAWMSGFSIGAEK